MSSHRLGLRVAAAVLATLVLPARMAAANEPQIPKSELPGLGPRDPRQIADNDALPWSALGRVQTELGGRCTGTLIGPRTVLTAAHCLVAPRSGRLVQPSSVHFLLGYRHGSWKAQARAVAVTAGPGFDARTRSPASADWALLTLDDAIGTAGGSLLLLRDIAARQTPLMLGGYQQDRPEVLMADTDCHALGLMQRDRHPMLVHNCAGTRGASGAPLLARGPDGAWAVAGIAVAVARSQPLGIAVPAVVVSQEREARGK
ncbi:MAG TPA: trypsin-like serine protease [Roseomonas sp.]|jgi:protease YdgD